MSEGYINISADDMLKIERGVRMILEGIGEDVTREGLQDTPKRVARAWVEFIEYDPGEYERTFETLSTDQLVVVRGIKVYSMCEHHLLPFSSTISIGYIATDRVLGLSKFARIAQRYAHRLQLQERLVHQIANEVVRVVGQESVAVYAQGEHLCMQMRGVQQREASMITSVMRGVFLTKPEARAEFLSLVR